MSSTSDIITIDFGNTNASCALFKNKKLVKKFPFSNLEENTKNNTHIFYASVTNMHTDIKTAHTNIADFFQEKKFLDMPVNYNETVGIDRLITSFYYYSELAKHIVIDCGTFTTIDFIGPEGFQGGYILPGLKLLQDSYQQGVNLKHFSPMLQQEQKIAHNSQDAINQGLSLTAIEPIMSIITQHSNTQIVLTGGNSDIFKEILSKRSNASIQIEPDLIHKSMQKIAMKVLD